ncbi:hypothetical protein [Sphingomonas sp. Y38-1Y]|uniref:hypothetical protein n=1 Tax=Sphingomonas sp. Y38-1Y TaxID=3078265 RepID=UPI0028EFB078|nr:hypothetical protein [Sphingomonas sp. Y38-1Y]
MAALIVIIAGTDQDRTATAFSLAGSNAALGSFTQLHLDAGATPMLAVPAVLDALIELRTLGVVVSICPTGLADLYAVASPLPDAESIGLVTLLAELPDDARLVVV